MEPSNRDFQEKEVHYPPTVTKEKWHSHILAKLARGYVLIVGTERRNANFFMRGKGFETCAYDAARQLVKAGVLVKAYDHYLGTAYTLAEVPTPVDRPPVVSPKPVDEMDALLNQLVQDDPDEEE